MAVRSKGIIDESNETMLVAKRTIGLLLCLLALAGGLRAEAGSDSVTVAGLALAAEASPVDDDVADVDDDVADVGHDVADVGDDADDKRDEAKDEVLRFCFDSRLVNPMTVESGLPKYRFFKSVEVEKPYRFMDDQSFVGIPLIAASLIIRSKKEEFRQNTSDPNPLHARNRLLTSFHTDVDDYIQYAPLVAVTGLKLAGVDGRSDWLRYLASAGMSYAIMAALANSLKYSVKEMRPDGSTANSFPSGHTATVFAGATILHKEYGLTHSPWYSVAGYTVATATGVLRVLNNRHWVSDVIAGAGIGILSTELAYGLCDLIFKGKGLRRTDLDDLNDFYRHPSFFALDMGVGFGGRDLTFDFRDAAAGDFSIPMRFKMSTVVGVEAAYFFHKYVGVGGRLRMRTTPVDGFGDLADAVDGSIRRFDRDWVLEDPAKGAVDYDNSHFVIDSDHLSEFTATAGVYFNYPLSRRFALGGKLLVGRSIITDLDVSGDYSGPRRVVTDPAKSPATSLVDEPWSHRWTLANITGDNTMTYGTGVSLSYAHKSSFAFRVFADYDYASKRYTMTYDPLQFVTKMWDTYASAPPEPYTSTVDRPMHQFTVGGSFCVSF